MKKMLINPHCLNPNIYRDYRAKGKTVKIIMRLIMLKLFLIFGMLNSMASVNSQTLVKSLKLENVELSSALEKIEQITSYDFVFSYDDVAGYKVNVNLENATLKQCINEVLKNKPFHFSTSDDLIIIAYEEVVDKQITEKLTSIEPIAIKGKITDSDGLPLPGATIVEKGTTNGTTSDIDGNYTLTVSGVNAVIQISYIGFETQEITVGAKKIINSVLKLSSNELDEVIVTGYSKRKKSSYTGATVSVTGKELKKYGNSNLIKSLQVFDPSFRIEENIKYGSDPNKLPKITVRGKASFPDLSKSKLKRNLNIPTFILDGFEVNVQRIYDLDLNRVKSVTILKDAASTAIYGSRASNGVIVVETKTPKAGSLQVTYTLDATITAPDLSDYHLMDAKTKLEAEVKAGYYPFLVKGVRNNKYQKKLSEIKKGVNTYWLSQPLQTLLSHKHTLSFEGGDESIRYGVNLKYDGKKGIMKGSERNNYSMDFDFSYTFKGIKISNNLSITKLKTRNSNYGEFSLYTQYNPYLRLKNKKEKFLSSYTDGRKSKLKNPLYEASLNSKDESKNLFFSNSLSIEIPLFQDCKFKIAAAYSEAYDNNDIFISPKSILFDGETDFTTKGKFSKTNDISSSIDGSAVITYIGMLYDDHIISTVIGCNIIENKSESNNISVVGFSSDRQSHISFGRKYESKIPDVSESTDRLFGVFANINYNFADRYFFDVSARLDKSSQFGKLNRKAPFWSIGIGWNIKNDLFKNIDLITDLKITSNIGTTGSINVQPYQAFLSYEYSKRYNENLTNQIKAIGNKNLKWQITFNRNIGFSSTLFGKYQLNFNYYLNTTKDLIIDVALPPSSGFKSFKSNLGEIKNKGWDISFSFNLIENTNKDFCINFFVNAGHNENKISKVGNYLKNYNDEITEKLKKAEKEEKINFDAVNNPVYYREGESLDAIYTVLSLGIDPATGQEIFVRKDGGCTYKWNPEDMVSVGTSTADINGYFGINLTYGKLNASISFNFQTGNTKTYNNTLVEKVENVDLKFNADERVLKDRWEKPGDIVPFRKILGPEDVYTRSSSRFIENVGILTLNSISIDYNPLSEVAIKKLGLQDLRLSINLNDLLHFSTIDQERGLSYPFSRSISFSIQAYF
jgi:TonB-linked SusC/RagA family outer membrane protein